MTTRTILDFLKKISGNKMILILSFLLLSYVLIGCCSFYKDTSIRRIFSSKLKNIRLGMTKNDIVKNIGQPDKIELFPYKILTKQLLLSSDRIFYPKNIPHKLTDDSLICFYSYPYDTIDSTGLWLFFSTERRLIGWSCEKHFLPDNWDDICAKQDKLRLSTQSH